MPTLLLSDRQSDDAQLLWRGCIAARWQVARVHGWRVPSISADDAVVYGEPLFAYHVAQTLGLKLLEPPVDWLPSLALPWRGREVRLAALGEARSVAKRAFIKPADEKCFDAKVYESGAALPAPGPLPETLPVLVQEIVQWESEFRCFVLDRRVRTVSVYCRDGKLAKTEEGLWPTSGDELSQAREFCQRVLDDDAVPVPRAVVLDVGIIRGRGWAVIESNAAFSSGIYGCEPAAVLSVLQRACTPSGSSSVVKD